MYLILFLCFCLCTLTLLSLSAKWIEFFRTSVLPYGKLNTTTQKPTSPLGHWLAQWTVPKAWFAHFYLVGLAMTIENTLEIIVLLKYQVRGPIMSTLYMLDNEKLGDTMSRQDCLVALTLVILHLARRVYESLYIERPSQQAKMHISHYLTGLGFYGAMVFGTWLEGAANLGVYGDIINNNHTSNMDSSKQVSIPTIVRTTLGVLLFLYATNHQHTCHHILGSLRKNIGSGYQIPQGDWFEWIVVPHYLCDILIYLALNILNGFKNWIFLCGLIWTTINLTITASETKIWYQKTFGDEYKKKFPKGRWIILPWVY